MFVCGSPLTTLFILYLSHLLSHSFQFFTHLKFVDNLRIPPKESMASIDETYTLTELLRQRKVKIHIPSSRSGRDYEFRDLHSKAGTTCRE